MGENPSAVPVVGDQAGFGCLADKVEPSVASKMWVAERSEGRKGQRSSWEERREEFELRRTRREETCFPQDEAAGKIW